ncbi:hypothetical protein RJ641_018379 [Dillenia turbinata]|uniref:Uncharacterized protein n=1 Tax=Dillenia turbinata TaxID=194707 RepID=A0AAN8Z1V2_9MAGN
MAEENKPKSTQQNLPFSTPSKSKPPEVSGEVGGNGNTKFHYPNQPDAVNPDAATLREQWKYATRQYSKWYSHAWGTAILAGLAFFALGWVIKGSNPLPSFKPQEDSPSSKQEDQQWSSDPEKDPASKV